MLSTSRFVVEWWSELFDHSHPLGGVRLCGCCELFDGAKVVFIRSKNHDRAGLNYSQLTGFEASTDKELTTPLERCVPRYYQHL